MKNHKKVVITGASGFLGRHIVKKLKEDELYEVYALSSRPEELKEKLDGRNITWLHKDALNVEVLKDAIVINCAYPRNFVGTMIADGLKYIQRVFENAVNYGAAAIINISSQSVYCQDRTEVATEESLLNLEGVYAVGKYATELLLESICNDTDVYYTNLRMASLIGPGFNQRIVNRFVMQALNSENITVSRNEKRFGFLDVEDAVVAINCLLENPTYKWKKTYTIGNNSSYSLEEIISIVLEELDSYNITKPQIKYEYSKETGNTSVDYKLLHKDTGFEPSVDLKTSVKRIIDDLIKNT